MATNDSCRPTTQHLSRTNEILFTDLTNYIKSSMLVELRNNFDEPPQESDFKHHHLNVEQNLTNATSLLSKISKNEVIPNRILILIILVAGENSKIGVWTNTKIMMYADSLLKDILNRCGYLDFSSLIGSEIDEILSELRPKLMKNSWRNYPAAVNCFIWILFSLKCPLLGEYLNHVLPTCLLLTDDHVYTNKVKGLQCLHHVASNVSRTDLNQYGQGAVIYKAVEHMIYLREPEIIPYLGKCLAALLSKTEHSPTSVSLSWNHFDDLLNVWLPSMEMEQKLVLREAYMDSLDGILQAMGLGSARWSTKLLLIFSDYCEQEHTCEKSLKSLFTFIKSAWPRISIHFHSIVFILMKVIINGKSKGSISKYSTRQSLLLVKKCFKALEELCHSDFCDFLTNMKKNDEMVHFYKLITEWEES
uniref:TELO2-interacting protein 2 n=1 Tax=Graphocephala atropunctata TaxID=36148 RepID=A0A1B6LV72_9HEMI